MRHVHFIGIGGVGMNGLAQLAARSGHDVSGSDRAADPESPLFRSLASLGIRVPPQDGSGIGPETARAVYSTAIESDNPDLLKARALGIPLLHRAEFLKELVGGAELIAVAGTAGKTTTTGLLGWIFERLGMDPSVYCGAGVLNWKRHLVPGNVRKGSSNLWIIEADESDRSLLLFHPAHAIITNISRDHFELGELRAMFDRFEAQATGTTIRGRSSDLAGRHCGPAPWRGGGFTFEGRRFSMPMPGIHNVENALCAVRLCAALGMDLDAVRDAVAAFKGIERRLETVGEAGGVTVIDDYAHNAAKIAAALAAAAECFGTVHAYWRPHGYAPLSQGLEELAEAFSSHWKRSGGSVFILPVYYAGGTVERKADSGDLVARLRAAGVPARLAPDYAALKRGIEARAAPGDAVLGMGARDPCLPIFARRLVEEWKTS